MCMPKNSIYIDNTLKWDKQVDFVCLNVSRKINLLKLLSKNVSRTGLNQYYNAYILPILDYGCLIWGRCSATNIKRILRLQKRAARIVLNTGFTTNSKIMFNTKLNDLRKKFVWEKLSLTFQN